MSEEKKAPEGEKTASAKLAEHTTPKKPKTVIHTQPVRTTRPKSNVAGKREAVLVDPANGKAVLAVDGQKFKVKCYIRRKDKEAMVAIAGQAVSITDWLAGKAQLLPV